MSMIAVANPAFKPLKNAVANAENPSVVIYVTAGREVSRMNPPNALFRMIKELYKRATPTKTEMARASSGRAAESVTPSEVLSSPQHLPLYVTLLAAAAAANTLPLMLPML